MKFEEKTENGIQIFTIKGKIMGGDPATMLRGKVQEGLEGGIRNFIINLEQVDWMNSIGLGMLVAILNTVTKAEGKLKLVNIDSIKKILLITRLVTIFEIHDSMEEALASIKETA